jgi:hypothetical protein
MGVRGRSVGSSASLETVVREVWTPSLGDAPSPTGAFMSQQRTLNLSGSGVAHRQARLRCVAWKARSEGGESWNRGTHAELFRGSAGPCAGGAICGGDRNSTAAVRVGRKSRTMYREAEQRGHFRWGKTAVLDEGGQNCPRGSALFAVLAPPAENRHAGIPAPGAETATASMERTSRRQTPQRRSASQKHWRRRVGGQDGEELFGGAPGAHRRCGAAPRHTRGVRRVGEVDGSGLIGSCRERN